MIVGLKSLARLGRRFVPHVQFFDENAAERCLASALSRARFRFRII
jgi:hypothetical protein